MSPFKRAEYYRKDGMKIGEGCSIAYNVEFGSEPYLITIGNNVRVTAGVEFITHDGGMWVIRNMFPEYRNMDLIKPIKVGNNVHIGTHSIIMPGVTIGDNCIIGCGAVVTKSVPSGSIVGGVPARLIESVEVYKEKNRSKYIESKNLSKEEKRRLLEKTVVSDESWSSNDN